VRLVWRLGFCLFGHLTLLLILAVYLSISAKSVQQYTGIANAEENQMESVDTVPALLGAMDAECHAWMRDGDSHAQASYFQASQAIEDSFISLQTPLLLTSPIEAQRRALVQQWIKEIGNAVTAAPGGKVPNAEEIDNHSKQLLEQLRGLTAAARSEVQDRLRALQEDETQETSAWVSRMWQLVGLVIFFTILIQLLLSNSIIAPIQALAAVVRRLQSGDYTARVRLRSGDEIQNLGETFNAMAENILRNQQELEEKNQRLSTQQEALRNANAGLEGRVAEKTEEIQRSLAKELALRQEVEDKNQKLNDAARLKDEFLATLSHELRTPLTPVISCAHLLGSDPALPPDQLKSVQVIERNARGLSRMIDELLDLSSVMNRKLRLERERVEMNEWTRVALETMRPAWEKKELQVTFTPVLKPVELEIDPTRLAQVVTNLINNAIKFTPAKGRITVGLTSTESDVRIAVADNGTGLRRDEIDKIFEMFHQSRTRQTQGVGGLGVGLTVARSLAELHGGGLLAESAGPGQGATFTLWLPRQTNALASADMSSTRPLPPVVSVDRTPLEGRSILIVEDSTDTREALERILQRRKCKVATTATGEEGLELARRLHPDIILSDIGLPGISGLEFMSQLRADPAFRNVIAIALSGLGRERDLKAAFDAGFEAHLLKPVDIAVLDQTLLDALEKKRPA
jgi:signal transduction histidine kinase/ActR/RegA family two-component response regulator